MWTVAAESGVMLCTLSGRINRQALARISVDIVRKQCCSFAIKLWQKENNKKTMVCSLGTSQFMRGVYLIYYCVCVKTQ